MARYQCDSEKSNDDDFDCPQIILSPNAIQSKRERQKQNTQSSVTTSSVVYNKDGSLPAGSVVNIVNTCLKDPEIARREKIVQAMREKELKELHDKELIFLEDNSDSDTMFKSKTKLSKSEQLRAIIAQEQLQTQKNQQSEQNTISLQSKESQPLYDMFQSLTNNQFDQIKSDQNKRPSIEKDPTKWEGTGLEDIVQNIQDNDAELVDNSNQRQYIDPVEKKKSKKKNKKDLRKKKKQVQEYFNNDGQSQDQIQQQNEAVNNKEKVLKQQQITTSLFQKSSPIQLPQKQREKQVLYDLNGPFYINEKFDFIQGHHMFPTTGNNFSERLIQQDKQSQNIHQNQVSSSFQNLKEVSKGQIISASKFYTLQECQSLACHFSQKRDMIPNLKASQNLITTKEGTRVFSNIQNNDISEITMHNDSQHSHKRQPSNYNQTQSMSQSNQTKAINRQAINTNAQNEQSIPSIKDWFGQLTHSERVLSMTTVDTTITGSIIQMFKQLRTNTPNDYHGKFRLLSSPQTFSVQVTEKKTKKSKNSQYDSQQPKCQWTMMMSNKSAHRSKDEVKQAETEFLKFVRITDSIDMHDTLTIKEDLVRQPEYFYKLAKQIVGSNFLIGRHNIVWLEGIQAFQSKQPLWIEMNEPNSLAAWILYYLERALCIQYDYNIYGCFDQNQQTLSKKDLIFLNADRLLICDEMRPSWRTFCQEVASNQTSELLSQFILQLKQNCFKLFGLQFQDDTTKDLNPENKKINQFHGGLALQNQTQEQLSDQIKSDEQYFLQLLDEYIERLKKSIISWEKQQEVGGEFQLDISELCMDQLLHVSAISDSNKVALPQLATQYNQLCSRLPSKDVTAALSQSTHFNKSSFETVHVSEHRITQINIEMRLERLMAQTFKEFRNQRLLKGHNSQSKKILKKKLKKKLQKEKEQERQRQKMEQQTDFEAKQQVITDQMNQNLLQQTNNNQHDFIKVNNSKAVQLLLGNSEHQIKQQNNHQQSKQNTQVQIIDKPHLESDISIVQATIRKSKNHDPFNYFQNLERQQTQHQNSTQIASSNCTVTTKTISTCDDSKQKNQIQLNQNFQSYSSQQLESAMSNQDIILFQTTGSKIQQSDQIVSQNQKQPMKEGNATLNNRDWQRKTNTRGHKILDEIIGELMSESSSHGKPQQKDKQNSYVIDLAVKDNKIHVKRDQIGTDNELSDDCLQNDSKSSFSSKKATNQMILFNKKHHRKVKPHEIKRSSSSSNSNGSANSSFTDQDLLPDVFNQFDPQPGDNDSSDFGAEEPHIALAEDVGAKSLGDDASSSIVYEKSMDNPSSIQAGLALQRPTNFSDKKSIHTANPKIEGGSHVLIQLKDKQSSNKQQQNQKIDFYKNRKSNIDTDDQKDIQDISASQIQSRVKYIIQPILEAFTCQKIELEKQFETNDFKLKQDTKPNKKKTKKQRQQEYLNFISQKNNNQQDSPKVKQIEIIKPEPIVTQNLKKKKNNETSKFKDLNTIHEKKKKKKTVTQEQVLNSFILKMQSNHSDVQNNESHSKILPNQIPIKGKKDHPINHPQKQELEPGNAKELHSIQVIDANKHAQSQSQEPLIKTSQSIKGNEHNQKSSEIQTKQISKISQSIDHNRPSQSKEHAFYNKSSQNISEFKNQQSLQTNDNTKESKSIPKLNENENPVQIGQIQHKSQEFKFQKKQQANNNSELNSQIKQSQKQKETLQFNSLKEALEYNESKVIEAENQQKFKQENKQISQTQSQLTTKLTTATSEKIKNTKNTSNSNQDHVSEKSQQSSQAKKKKSRKKKESKNHDGSNINLQLQESYIDPITGQTVYMGQNAIQQSSQLSQVTPSMFGTQIPVTFGQENQNINQDGFIGNSKMQQFQQLQQHILNMQRQQQVSSQNNQYNSFQHSSAQSTSNSLLGTRAMPNLQQQVEELVFQIREQYLVQQQMQMAELQRRQIEQEEMQIRDDCEPCAEENEERFHRFFEELGHEMLNKVKEIDTLKDSVRREREGFIKIVEQIVKDTFQNRDGNGYVGIKMFGSMVTDLAIETSDVDLVVTGINTNHQIDKQDIATPKEQILRVMQKLYDNILLLKSSGQIQKIKFIREATVPIIKLVADLQIIHQIQIEKAKVKAKKDWLDRNNIKNRDQFQQNIQLSEQKFEDVDMKELGIETVELDQRMRFLQVDISIDEQSDSQIDINRKHGIPSNQNNYLTFEQQVAANSPNTRSPIYAPGLTQTNILNQSTRGHNGIDTIYHIQELQKSRKHLRPIVMIIKKIFDQTFLSTPFYGGLSSYSLVLMVSAYLKRFDETNTESLSRNLSGFFHFYGCYFKPQEFYLDGDNIKFEEIKRPFRDPFIVLDPLDRSNNIGRGSFRIKDVQRAFVQAFKIINKSCEQYQQIKNPQSLPESDISNRNCLPHQVLNRLLTEIQQLYIQNIPNFLQSDTI